MYHSIRITPEAITIIQESQTRPPSVLSGLSRRAVFVSSKRSRCCLRSWSHSLRFARTASTIALPRRCSRDPAFLRPGDDDVVAVNLVAEVAGPPWCRTRDHVPGNVRIGGVIDAEVTGAGHQRVLLPTRGDVPSVPGRDLVPVRD